MNGEEKPINPELETNEGYALDLVDIKVDKMNVESELQCVREVYSFYYKLLHIELEKLLA